MNVISHSGEETKKIAEKFAQTLQPGDLVLLVGDLGAGKTTFVQGLATGLAAENPTSPSFTIVQEYQTPKGLFRHVDLYRLDNPTLDVETIGLPEIISDPIAITAVEWPERLSQTWERQGRTIRIQIKHVNSDTREINIEE